MLTLNEMILKYRDRRDKWVAQQQAKVTKDHIERFSSHVKETKDPALKLRKES